MIDLRAVRRPLVALLLLASFTPTLAFGQHAKAGVVTTLEGNVVAVRGGLSQPVPLKFRDDVFLNDRITTGDRSIVRLLLGGKAVVTVRERSSLTVTEVPGRATINLDSGKIGVAVARERMRPGDTLEVQTPNAVAGVRGTVFIVDVSQATAQATPQAPDAVTTQIVTLQGSVGVQFAGPAGAIPGTIVVGANQFATQTGTSGTPRSGVLTPEQRAAALAGLRASIRATGAANSDQVKEQLTQTTAAALGTLLGDSITPLLPGITPTKSPSDTNALNSGVATINACTTDPTVCQPQSPPPPTGTGIPSSLLVNDLSGHLVAHDPLLPTANPNPYVVSVSDAAIMTIPAGLSAPVVVTSDDLFAVTRGGVPVNTLLQRPLLLANSDLTLSRGNILRVDDMLTSLTTSPLISVNSAALDVNACAQCSRGGGIVAVSGVDRLLTLVGGPLLSANTATITTGGDVIFISDDGAIASLTTGPLVSVTSGSLTARALLDLDTRAVAFLTGPLLVSTNTAGRNRITSTSDLIGVTGGAALFGDPVSAATALVQSDHTDYDVGQGGIAFRHFFRVQGTGGVGGIVPSSVALTGTLLASSQDTFNVTGAMLAVGSGSLGSIVNLVSTTTHPLMSFDGGRVTLGASTCGGNAGCIASATGTGNFIEVNPFTSMTLHGPIATVTAPSHGWVMDTLVSSFSSEGLTTSGHTGPLFSFDGATGTPHTVNGAMFDLGGFTRVPDIDPDAPVAVLLGSDEPLRHGGTLYQGTGGATIITTNVVKLDTALMAAMAPLVSLAGAGTALTSASDAFALTQRAKLTASIPADALVKVNTGATFTVTNGSLVSVAGGSFASLNVAALVSLAGGSTMSLLNGLLATVSGNGSFALTGALVSFSGSNNTLVVNNGYVPTGFINGVPVYSALGGTTGFNITRTNANLFTGLNASNNVIQINGVALSANATSATGSLLAITGGATSKIKLQ